MKVMVASLFLLLGTVLLPAVTEDTPVQCPNWNLSCKDYTIENSCDCDQDCFEDGRCCDVCGRRCFDPQTLAEFIRCPVLIKSMLEGSSLQSCETNQDCDSEQRCCKMCGRKICSVSDLDKKYPVWTSKFPNLPWRCDMNPPKPMEAEPQD